MRRPCACAMQGRKAGRPGPDLEPRRCRLAPTAAHACSKHRAQLRPPGCCAGGRPWLTPGRSGPRTRGRARWAARRPPPAAGRPQRACSCVPRRQLPRQTSRASARRQSGGCRPAALAPAWGGVREAARWSLCSCAAPACVEGHAARPEPPFCPTALQGSHPPWPGAHLAVLEERRRARLLVEARRQGQRREAEAHLRSGAGHGRQVLQARPPPPGPAWRGM